MQSLNIMPVVIHQVELDEWAPRLCSNDAKRHDPLDASDVAWQEDPQGAGLRWTVIATLIDRTGHASWAAIGQTGNLITTGGSNGCEILLNESRSKANARLDGLLGTAHSSRERFAVNRKHSVWESCNGQSSPENSIRNGC
jgi:hypothetical protein